MNGSGMVQKQLKMHGRLMCLNSRLQGGLWKGRRLPEPQSELAIETMKDPYIFDFVEIREGMIERDIENELIKHITNFLLEMGSGFAYMGHQKLFRVGEEEFFPDLLFYNTILHCYVVIELKMKKFIPEYAGKMNFYLSVVDEQLKAEKSIARFGGVGKTYSISRRKRRG